MKRKKRTPPQKKIETRLPKIQFTWPRVNLLLVALSILAIALLIFNLFIIPRIKSTAAEVRPPKVNIETRQTVRNTLAQFGIFEDNLSPEGEVTRVVIPHDFSFYTFYAVLRAELENINAEIIDSQKVDDGTLMIVGRGNDVSEHYLFSKSRRVQTESGSAAIIIDDFGYSANKTARAFLNMTVPITISIIPGLDHSQRIADLATVQQKEVIIHMPMEPQNEEVHDNGFTIFAGQEDARVSLRLRQAFAQIPMAKGLNNHQGSKATADAHVMTTVMQTLQGMNKFFVDSWTSQESVAYETARRHNVPTARNQLFLDAEDDKKFIRNQMHQMARLAKERGNVVAIGHVRKNTLDVLEEMIPVLKASGVTFVNASDVVN